jgi:hypothetical protein
MLTYDNCTVSPELAEELCEQTAARIWHHADVVRTRSYAYSTYYNASVAWSIRHNRRRLTQFGVSERESLYFDRRKRKYSYIDPLWPDTIYARFLHASLPLP